GGQETLIGADRRAGEVFVDRSRSGDVRFSPHFAGRHAAPRATGDRTRPVRLHVLVDATSVEVFADDGAVVLTDQVFPGPDSRAIGAMTRMVSSAPRATPWSGLMATPAGPWCMTMLTRCSACTSPTVCPTRPPPGWMTRSVRWTSSPASRSRWKTLRPVAEAM